MVKHLLDLYPFGVYSMIVILVSIDNSWPGLDRCIVLGRCNAMDFTT